MSQKLYKGLIEQHKADNPLIPVLNMLRGKQIIFLFEWYVGATLQATEVNLDFCKSTKLIQS